MTLHNTINELAESLLTPYETEGQGIRGDIGTRLFEIKRGKNLTPEQARAALLRIASEFEEMARDIRAALPMSCPDYSELRRNLFSISIDDAQGDLESHAIRAAVAALGQIATRKAKESGL